MPAKKAAKKAAKKVATKKTTKLTTTMEDPDALPVLTFKRKFSADDSAAVYASMTESVRRSVDVVSNRSKTRKINLLTPAMLRKMLVSYDDIFFQNAIASVGFRVPTVIEVIAPEHIGKTTWAFDMIGRLASQGCHTIYIECEGKMMSGNRIKRLLHRDKKTALHLMNTISFATARSLVECDAVIKQTVTDMRLRCDSDPATKGNPIWIFVDPWSGLMSSAEAKGNSEWGVSPTAKKEVAKDAGTGSNMGHSKHAQILKRWLPNFLEKNNAAAVFFNHQNAKVDMSGFKMPGMGPPPESTNDTTIGGRAFRQFSSYRFIMTSKGDIKAKDKKTSIGTKVQLSVKKNAYGPKSRKCEFELYFDQHSDTSTTYDRVISFAEPTAVWMAQNKILDTTLSNKLYTCDALGCVAVTGEELYAALKADPEQWAFVGSVMGIEGYESTVAAASREAALDGASYESEEEDEADGSEDEA